MYKKALSLFLLKFSVLNFSQENIKGVHELFQDEIQAKTEMTIRRLTTVGWGEKMDEISEKKMDDVKQKFEEKTKKLKLNPECLQLKREIVNLSLALNLLNSNDVPEENKKTIRFLSAGPSRYNQLKLIDDELKLKLENMIFDFKLKCSI